jgi:hypothetical protein
MPGSHAIGVSEHGQIQRKCGVGEARQGLAQFVDRGVAESLAPPLLDFGGERLPHLLRAPAAGFEAYRLVRRLDADVPPALQAEEVRDPAVRFDRARPPLRLG